MLVKFEFYKIFISGSRLLRVTNLSHSGIFKLREKNSVSFSSYNVDMKNDMPTLNLFPNTKHTRTGRVWHVLVL